MRDEALFELGRLRWRLGESQKAREVFARLLREDRPSPWKGQVQWFLDHMDE